MELLLSIMIGSLYASGIYMLLRRSMVKMIIGLILLGNGVNLLIFLLGGVSKGKPPILSAKLENFADPVPQALILTAIVISFGLQAFAIVLVQKVYEVLKTDDLDMIQKLEGDL
ncbi:MAG: Na+/H+ antiporter subunit C [Leptospira sp.]|nr:Na+/H+ antiporter subunit C [Leptospira sp.]